jgi:LPXTG-motif cell wall-anchored protein
MTRRRTTAIAAALLGWIVGAPPALADASFDPNVPTQAEGGTGVPILPIALAAVIGVALVALLRARGAGAVLSLLGVLAVLAVGGLFIAAGLFGDLSGRHEIFPIPILIGLAVIAGGLLALWRRRRSEALAP